MAGVLELAVEAGAGPGLAGRRQIEGGPVLVERHRTLDEQTVIGDAELADGEAAQDHLQGHELVAARRIRTEGELALTYADPRRVAAGIGERHRALRRQSHERVTLGAELAVEPDA